MYHGNRNVNYFIYQEEDGFLRLIYKLIEMLI